MKIVVPLDFSNAPKISKDKKLLAYVEKHGHGIWQKLFLHLGFQRCGKSYRLKWINYLRPDIKRAKFSP
ncbi:hypothetical protein Peur_031849 [Populus x canadensis]